MVFDGVVIDISFFQFQYFFYNSLNFLFNLFFEIFFNEVMMDVVNIIDICNETMNYYFVNWILFLFGCVAVVIFINNFVRDGRFFLFVRGSVTQILVNLVEGGLYRLVFFISYLLISSFIQFNKEGFVKFGNKSYVFFIYIKVYRGDGYGKLELREIIFWYKYMFYFIVQGIIIELIFGSVDEKIGIFLDYVIFEYVQRDVNGSSELYVQVYVVYLYEWGFIYGLWSFVEDVSFIIEYFWVIGKIFNFIKI